MLPNIRVASPCPADWEKMIGDERVRHCNDCNLNVYNFSAMTEREVARLLAARQGRLCGRFYRRADGTMLTQNCPVGLRRVTLRISRFAAVLFSAFSVQFSAAQRAISQSPNLASEVNQDEGSIEIRLIDQQGAVFANAEIGIHNTKTKQELAIGRTDSDGILRIAHLPVSEYVIVAQRPGFDTSSQLVKLTRGGVFKTQIILSVAANMNIGVVVEVDPTPIEPIIATTGEPLSFVPLQPIAAEKRARRKSPKSEQKSEKP